MPDYTKYKLDGNGNFPKNRLVLEVIKKYINKNPNMKYSELLEKFPNSLQGSIGVIKNEQDMNKWENDGRREKRESRFFTNSEEILKLGTERIYVCTEWGSKHHPNFIKHAKELGFDITESSTTETEVIINPKIGNEMNIKNIILYGAPGVGKTHNYKNLISLIEKGELEEKDIFKKIEYSNIKYDLEEFDDDLNSRVEFITFHQSFGYEDFIEGFRPNEEGKIQLEDGIFKTICEKANENKEQNFYLVIDEINRGNISKIFGELITLIEESKRAKENESGYEVTLPYSKEKFSIPSNLYIIGTMNTTDKSIALIDVALRRRFTFIKMKPNSNLVDNQKAKDLMEKLNKQIGDDGLGEEYQIGHSYFMDIDDSDLDFIKEYKVKPLLEEYYYGDEDKLKVALNIIGIEETND